MLKKFFLFSYGSFVGLIIGFLGTIITTRILLPEDFGKAAIFTLVINILMMFVLFGTDQSFIRFFYEESEENRVFLLYNCLLLPTIILCIISIILLIFYKKISIILFDEITFSVIFCILITMITQVYYRFAVLVIRMQQKGNIFSILEILSKSFNIMFFLIFYIIFGKTYKILVYSTTLSACLLLIIAFSYEKKFWIREKSNYKKLLHTRKEIILYGMPLVLTVIITWLFQGFDKIALKKWSNFYELGVYTAAFKIVALLNVFQLSFATFWTPISLEKFEKNKEDIKFYSKTSKIVTSIMFFIAIVIITFKNIIIIFLGDNYIKSANIVPFLVFMPVMYTISETTVIGITFYKKTKWNILIAIIPLFFNILGNWILVPKIGAIGAAISTAISYIIFFVLRTYISLIYFKVDYGLKKLFFSLYIILIYSFLCIKIENKIYNILIGIIVLFFHILIYYSEFKYGYFYFINILKNNKKI